MSFGFQSYTSNMNFGSLVVQAYAGRKQPDGEVFEPEGLDGVPTIGTGINNNIFQGVDMTTSTNRKHLMG